MRSRVAKPDLSAFQGAQCIKIDLSRRSEQLIDERVAVEVPVNVYVNGEQIATLFATPTEKKELAVGYLLGEGIVRAFEEIQDAHIMGNEVKIRVKSDLGLRIKAAKNFRVVSSACGSTEDFYRLLDRIEKPHVSSEYAIDAETLLRLVRELNELSSSSRAIAVHGAALFDNESLFVYVEDVGRHNAVDKVIGRALISGRSFDRSVLITTGRQSADMVLKAARARIPITVTIRDPLYSGIYVAEKTGVTMVADARGPSMKIYTHPQRILYPFKVATLAAK